MDYHIELGEFPAMPQAQRTQRHHRTQKPHKQYKYAIMLDDPRQDDDDFCQRPNLPEEDALLRSLEQSIQACHAVLNTHGEGCPCNVCYDVNGLLYNLYSGRDLIDCLL